MWKKKYSKIENDETMRWTNENERLLKGLKNKKVESYESTGIYKRAVESRLEFLESRIDNIPEPHAVALAMRVLQKWASKEDVLQMVEDTYDSDYKTIPSLLTDDLSEESDDFDF